MSSQGQHSPITTKVSQTMFIRSIKLFRAMNAPKMLDKILSKHIMCLLVFNLPVDLKEL